MQTIQEITLLHLSTYPCYFVCYCFDVFIFREAEARIIF